MIDGNPELQVPGEGRDTSSRQSCERRRLALISGHPQEHSPRPVIWPWTEPRPPRSGGTGEGFEDRLI